MIKISFGIIHNSDFCNYLHLHMQKESAVSPSFVHKIDPKMIQNLESQDIFKILFESAGEGLILVDKKGTMLMANPRMEEMFGYGKDELIGSSVDILVPDAFRHNHMAHRESYNNHPKKRSMGAGMDLTGRRKDGSLLPIEISLNYFNSGDEMVVMGLVTDITERKKIERELSQLNSDLEQRVEDRTQMLAGAIKELEYSNKSLEKAEEDLKMALETEKELGELKSRFVTTASHEFRTPLATILSSVSLIAKYTRLEDEEKRQKHIDRIKASVTDLREILNDFLSVSKLEEGKMRNTPAKFKLTPFCKGIAEEMRMHAKPGQQIEYTHEGGEDVFLDNQILKNILVNLLSNAIKFSDEGGKIYLYSAIQDGEIQISVKDNGIGMSEEDQKHLFERFFRAKNAGSIQGTGLGLNIVRKYVELMDGEISFSSEINKGSTFTAVFPFRS
jgi:PAS domain S-box-containing protein